MTASADDAVALLRSIDTTLKQMLALAQQRTQRAAAPAAPSVDLDGQHGDPVIKAKDPRNWPGQTMKGRPMSECPPEYLDMLAERYDYFNTTLGDSEDDRKKRKYNTLDASRARAWAARLRSGWQSPAERANPWGAAPATPAAPAPAATTDPAWGGHATGADVWTQDAGDKF